MVNRIKRNWYLLVILIIGLSAYGFISGGEPNEIKWVSFDEAVKLNEQHPRKIIIDIYTPWCGWCKKMDADTYTDPAIVSYISKNFYAVRLDAETADTFHFKGHKFYNLKPHTRGYTNELASSLMDGKLSFPTTVYMDENFSRLTYLQTYITAADLKPILRYFVENKYKSMSFEAFKKSAQDTVKAKSN